MRIFAHEIDAVDQNYNVGTGSEFLKVAEKI